MIFNEIGINRKLFKPVLVLIALYFVPRITPTKVGRTLKFYIKKQGQLISPEPSDVFRIKFDFRIRFNSESSGRFFNLKRVDLKGKSFTVRRGRYKGSSGSFLPWPVRSKRESQD